MSSWPTLSAQADEEIERERHRDRKERRSDKQRRYPKTRVVSCPRSTMRWSMEGAINSATANMRRVSPAHTNARESEGSASNCSPQSGSQPRAGDAVLVWTRLDPKTKEAADETSSAKTHPAGNAGRPASNRSPHLTINGLVAERQAAAKEDR